MSLDFDVFPAPVVFYLRLARRRPPPRPLFGFFFLPGILHGSLKLLPPPERELKLHAAVATSPKVRRRRLSPLAASGEPPTQPTTKMVLPHSPLRFGVKTPKNRAGEVAPAGAPPNSGVQDGRELEESRGWHFRKYAQFSFSFPEIVYNL